MVDFNNIIKSFVGEIPDPISNELNEVEQELIKPNQYEGVQVQEKAFQNTTPYILDFTSTGSVTLTEDIIVFGVQVALRVTGATKEYDASIAINGANIAAAYITTDSSNRAETNFYTALPNYKLTKGDRIAATLNVTVGAGHDEHIILLGFKV